MITRRHFTKQTGLLLGGGLMALSGCLRVLPAPQDTFQSSLAVLERRSGGRLGVAMIDTGTGRIRAYRGEERFPVCSTFKVLAAAAILSRVDAGRESLDRLVRFDVKDVVDHSPATAKQAGGPGMTLAAICRVAITLSDNTAGNLMLRVIGGPAGLTRYARGLGDRQTRLDRTETALNEALPGDARDTTTPMAMARNLNRLIFGTALSAASKDHLSDWMRANTTGGKRLRAGLPKDWTVGDKTGTGERGTANDVAVIWPGQRPPVILTVYLTGATVPADTQNDIIAAVGSVVRATLQEG